MMMELEPSEPLFLLVSFKRRFADGLVIFWGPNAAGYTPDLSRAGTYTAEEAARHEDPETVAVPVEWVYQNARIRTVIDKGDSHKPKNNIFWSASNLRHALAPNA